MRYALTLALGMGLAGCTWITDAEWAAFNDRDGDGIDHAQDCDDGNSMVQDTVDFYPDVDGDGFGDASAQPKPACANDAPAGHVQDNTDCNDGNPDAMPGGIEVCDAVDADEDCNGAADDADNDAEGKVLWFSDADGDLFGDEDDSGVMACDPPSGTEVQDNTDCDDTRDHVNPDGTEVCDPDAIDEDCNGLADDLDAGVDAASLIQWYDDADGDGYGNPDVPLEVQCSPPGGRADNNTDCDDLEVTINPGATEVCDPLDIDEDCNQLADDDDAGVDINTFSDWYPDADGDGYGEEYSLSVPSCDGDAYQATNDLDCDDTLEHINPDGTEVCDDLDHDEDCNGLSDTIDPNVAMDTWWPDSDGDLFGDQNATGFETCDPGPTDVNNGGDCDDTDPNVFPGAPEYHDGFDTDCDPAGVNNGDYICGEATARVYTPATCLADCDFDSIQAAIDAIDQSTWCDGDIIEVNSGTYTEAISIIAVAPILRGKNGSPLTTIDCSGMNTRCVYLNSTPALVEGFTITGGNVGGDGGGVQVFQGVDTTLRDLLITGNSAVNGGGIDVLNPDNVSIIDTVVTGNFATGIGDGGGIRIKSIGGSALNTTLLSTVTVTGNDSNDIGGGIALEMDTGSIATVVIEDSVIESNTAVKVGGLNADTVPALEIRDTDIRFNTSTASQGGVLLDDAPAVLERVVLEGNTGVTVGALQAQGYNRGSVTLIDVVAADNVLSVPGGNGYGIYLKGDATFGSVLERVQVTRTLRDLGSIWGAGLTVEGKVQADNVMVTCEDGPAALAFEESVLGGPATHALTHATLVGNSGDGLRVGAASATSLTVTNIITAFNDGYGINDVYLAPAVSYSAAWSNQAGDYANVNPWGANNNQQVDPFFIDYDPLDPCDYWNLALDRSQSSLVDAGSGTDLDGSVADMGYFGGPLAP